MHHLILVREIDSYAPTARGPEQTEGVLGPWDGSSLLIPERRERMTRIAEIYRAVREAFADDVEVTMVDPRNVIAFLGLVARDAVRFRVPPATALRSFAGNRASAAVFDGQILFEGTPPPVAETLELIRGRLVVHRA
jgi:hypothetical protein